MASVSRETARAGAKDGPAVRFVNAFEPPAPLLADVLPELERRGVASCALLSPAGYRDVGSAEAFRRQPLAFPVRTANKRINAAQFGLLAPFALLRTRASLNVFLTQPPLFHALGGWVSARSRTPYLVHVMDLYPELFARAGLLDPGRPPYRLLHRWRTRSLTGARRVVAIGRCMRDRLVEAGVDPGRIRVIPNWAADNLRPAPRRPNSFRDAHGLGDAFVVMYSGNMGASHMLETLLDVSERLAARRDVRFVFVGRGSRRQEVEARIRAGAPNITLLDYQPAELLPHSLAAADVHFVSLRAGFEGLVVPSKIYGILAAGRPAIYEGVGAGEVARTLREHGCGSVVEPGDGAALEAAVLRYRDDPDLRAREGASAAAAYEEHYAPERSARAYADLVCEVLAETAGAAAAREVTT